MRLGEEDHRQIVCLCITHLSRSSSPPFCTIKSSRRRSDNATIFDALVEGKADLMITDGAETGVLCPVHGDAPFGHSELAYWMPGSDLRGLRESMAKPTAPSRNAAASLAGRTSFPSPPDSGVVGFAGGKTVRSIRMTLSLAFLAPEIVEAAVEGRLSRGFGPKRLVDLPTAWPRSDCRRQRRYNE
jgi:hypothetical protein